jgi:hypothetical protein
MTERKTDTNSFALKQGKPAFHKLASCFPLLTGADYAALVADIKMHGLIEPIVLFEGKILDGRNRYRACLGARVEPRYRNFTGTYAEAAAFVISANIHRRHLTPKDKRKAIAELLKASPEQSDRRVAKIAKVSPTTVGTVRAEMEAKGEVSKLDTRTDTKGRKQPAKKVVAKPKAVAKPIIKMAASGPRPRVAPAREDNAVEVGASTERSIDGCVARMKLIVEIAIALMPRRQHTHRYPRGRGQSRHHSQVRGGIDRAGPGRHLHHRRLGRGVVVAGDTHRADRVRGRPGSGWLRLRR